MADAILLRFLGGGVHKPLSPSLFTHRYSVCAWKGMYGEGGKEYIV